MDDASICVSEEELLLYLDFENSLTDDRASVARGPVSSSDVKFECGRVGLGAHVSGNLSYAGSIMQEAVSSTVGGTIELWVKPSWPGADLRSHHFVMWPDNGFLLQKDGAGKGLAAVPQRSRRQHPDRR